MQGQQTDSVATAIQMLAVQNLALGIRPIALTSPNAFRTERLYTEEVDLLYKKHLVLLKAIYSASRRAPNGGGLRLKVCPLLLMAFVYIWRVHREASSLRAFRDTFNVYQSLWPVGWLGMLQNHTVQNSFDVKHCTNARACMDNLCLASAFAVQ